MNGISEMRGVKADDKMMCRCAVNRMSVKHWLTSLPEWCDAARAFLFCCRKACMAMASLAQAVSATDSRNTGDGLYGLYSHRGKLSEAICE